MQRQLSLFGGPVVSEPYTVSQLNASIRRLLESDPNLADLWVEGEISNFSRPSSGHCYFTLKDADSEIGCVMWRTVAERQDYLPDNGVQVLAHGRIGVYEARGRYQLYVDQVRPAGLGSLYLQFERLRARLEAEGLFAQERKRPLPPFPRRVGVVTSPSAAALRDIVHVLRRRYPLADLVLSPTLVQGTEAPVQIVAALEALNCRSDIDVVIVARGGGSLEELWAFNDERVVRAIAASGIPVVCGVGHETDFSLADFAADVRAPTPSAAAERVTPDRVELHARIGSLRTAQIGAFLAKVDAHRWRLAEQKRALRHLSPGVQIRQARLRLDDLLARAGATVNHNVGLYRERLSGLTGRLGTLGPSATLERGYAIVRQRETGEIVHSRAQVSAGDALDVRVSDGEFGTTVT
jgi:exodeoxyribonuclease VII large subunit